MSAGWSRGLVNTGAWTHMGVTSATVWTATCWCLTGPAEVSVSLTNTHKHTHTHLCDYYWLKGGYFHPLSIFSLTCCCFLISLLVCSLDVLLWSFSSLHSRCVHLNACTGQCRWHTFSIMKYISPHVWARLTVASQSFDRLLWLKPRVDLLHYSSSAVWRTPVKNPTRAKMKIWMRQSYNPWVNVQVWLVAPVVFQGIPSYFLLTFPLKYGWLSVPHFK